MRSPKAPRRRAVIFRSHGLLQIKQGTLRFPCAGFRQLPFCGLAIWEQLALQAVPTDKFHKIRYLFDRNCRRKGRGACGGKVMDGSGGVSLTAEEHEVLIEYFRLQFRLDDMERGRLYFHTDCISYLKKVGAL